MRNRSLVALLVGAALGVSIGCTNDPDQLYYELGQTDGLTAVQLRGREVYRRHCIGCHGLLGDGKGPAATLLDPRPRDFTRGVFKFRTTPTSSLPAEGDLLRTLREGVHGTSMPSWRLLPDDQLKAVVEYLKTFSPRWQRDRPKPALALPGAPPDLAAPERIERGRLVWAELQCSKCHGEGGKGDGPSSKTLTDSEDNPIKAFDFTRRSPKGGARPEDLYRTFMTGLAGTPMPDFSASTTDDTQRWDLVAFVLSLRNPSQGKP